MESDKHYIPNSSEQELNILEVDFQSRRFQEVKLSPYQEYSLQNNTYLDQEEIRSQIQKAQVRQRERHKARLYRERDRA
ncbi:hypothetical protein COU53_01870 [Candidatus Pacearchaeota archaeon CG10_big_fil_rev_8_21_14_0_10_30_48]|nr:MAG: hypothetical protein COU53_01870 [Candidatus Pacearchaeota archaeon CG10_big_fil_rev_8_21_14_0_10_30_48]